LLVKNNRSGLNNLSEYPVPSLSFPDFNKSLFDAQAMALFRYQYAQNPVYRDFCSQVAARGRVLPEASLRFPGALPPFLPIRFFKTHRVLCGDGPVATWFESSGTTQTGQSQHEVRDLSVYESSFLEGFRLFYGDPGRYCFLALLPSYLERGHSSLVYMADRLIRESGNPRSGFYLDQFDRLADVVRELEAAGQPTILLGVTFALLDFAEAYPLALKHTIVMETGGMKGRKRELTRAEVHGFLQERWGLRDVHAEYGMTELLSQAYAQGDGRFFCPPWMRVVLRAEDDPFALTDAQGQPLREGLINIIDLANIHSSAFIATDDLGRLHPDGSFEVLGRMDHADIRGCSLLTA
jgi:hypothetical protein